RSLGLSGAEYAKVPNKRQAVTVAQQQKQFVLGFRGIVCLQTTAISPLSGCCRCISAHDCGSLRRCDLPPPHFPLARNGLARHDRRNSKKAINSNATSLDHFALAVNFCCLV